MACSATNGKTRQELVSAVGDSSPLAVIDNEHREVEKGLEVLNELIESGRNLLRAQPMNKDGYFKWSDDARTKIAECFGENSPKTQKFLKARWEIAATPDSDPSIYMSQVGANLNRELKMLRRFLEEEGGAPG